MTRKEFIKLSLFSGTGAAVAGTTLLESCHTQPVESESAFKKLVFTLLKDWCDGMINQQVLAPNDPKTHGMLECPSCSIIHGRIIDAVYPLLYMASETGQNKYRSAAVALLEWGQNVTRPDGAWTNVLNPKSWDGTTVFGAIAVGEALLYHGDVLDQDTKATWKARLHKAAEFCYHKFPKVDFTNINYGVTNLYAMALLGDLLDEPKYTELSRKLAIETKEFFTKKNGFLFGEIKPAATVKSEKGLQGVDLGYNIEESLNGIIMYALHAQDEVLLNLATKSVSAHLEFMLPDGGWDNCWGTRMYKWTYWGSRTCDGSQPALAFLANQIPSFGTAAYRNTQLLRDCTHNGLLHGGIHYQSHGIKPCIHHTFAHAKPLATLLDNWHTLGSISTDAPLPRETADGIKYFSDLDVTLFARGEWRGTVSAYDADYYYKKECRQASGASLGMLYHNKVGVLCAASMAEYTLIEPNNQQVQPNPDFAFTPRIETNWNGESYSNLYDLGAIVESSDSNLEIHLSSKVTLRNKQYKQETQSASDFTILYQCKQEHTKITVETVQDITRETTFILPIVSASSETVRNVNSKCIAIEKTEGTVLIQANQEIKIKESSKGRLFNMVPGMEALPLFVKFDNDSKKIELTISVS